MAIDAAKESAARFATTLVKEGMTVGLGSGSTSRIFVQLLGEKPFAPTLRCVSTSSSTDDVARSVGLRLVDPNEVTEIDLTVDGADEATPGLELIKGGGGALLREKLVATMTRFHVTIVDSSKMQPTLGSYALPVEVVPYALQVVERWVRRQIEQHGAEIEWLKLRRDAAGALYKTDNHNNIFDIKVKAIQRAASLGERLKGITGVVDHGLFVDLTHLIVCSTAAGQIKEYRK